MPSARNNANDREQKTDARSALGSSAALSRQLHSPMRRLQLNLPDVNAAAPRRRRLTSMQLCEGCKKGRALVRNPPWSTCAMTDMLRMLNFASIFMRSSSVENWGDEDASC